MSEINFETAFVNFVALLQAREITYVRANYPSLTPATFTAEPGRRYIRIVKDNGQRSVHCFVEKGTGNIYKAATWKAPTTKHVRGSIFADNPLAGTNVYGANLCGNLDGMNNIGN